jgi:hypothetical protein
MAFAVGWYYACLLGPDVLPRKWTFILQGEVVSALWICAVGGYVAHGLRPYHLGSAQVPSTLYFQSLAYLVDAAPQYFPAPNLLGARGAHH